MDYWTRGSLDKWIKDASWFVWQWATNLQAEILDVLLDKFMVWEEKEEQP